MGVLAEARVSGCPWHSCAASNRGGAAGCLPHACRRRWSVRQCEPCASTRHLRDLRNARPATGGGNPEPRNSSKRTEKFLPEGRPQIPPPPPKKKLKNTEKKKPNAFFRALFLFFSVFSACFKGIWVGFWRGMFRFPFEELRGSGFSIPDSLVGAFLKSKKSETVAADSYTRVGTSLAFYRNQKGLSIESSEKV